MKNSLLFGSLFLLSSLGLFAQTPPPTNALSFQNDDYVDIDNIAQNVAGLTSFTIEFWVRFETQNNTNYNTFYGVNSNDYGNRMVIRVSGSGDNTTGTVVVYMENSSSKYLIGQINVGDNKCHHVAFTYDNQQCKLYIDGQLDVSTNHYFKFESSDLHSLGQEYDKTPVPTSSFYNGEMDEFRIWNFAKTQTEIQNNRSSELTGNENGLLEYFNFNQGTANGNNTSISYVENKANPSTNGTLIGFNLKQHSRFSPEVELSGCKNKQFIICDKFFLV